MSIALVYKNLCPVCGGDLEWKEIESGNCNRLGTTFLSLEEDSFREFSDFFEERTGMQLKSLQRYFAKKLLSGLSFSAFAPTGYGKTLLGLVYSAYLAEKGKKCYLLFPTVLLANQSFERLKQLTKSSILFYQNKSPKEREKFLERLQEGNFDILLTTTAFLGRHFDSLSQLRFDFILVDDVDALLKASRNIERVLMLLGFSQQEIEEKKPDTSKKHGQLLVSTATSRPGPKARIFTNLLHFSVGSTHFNLRNIDDYAIYCDDQQEKLESLLCITKNLGYGGLIFANTEQEVEELATFLSKHLKCGVITSQTTRKELQKTIQEFEEGKKDLLLGVAAPYGILVRGLDYPLCFRYTLFWGAPFLKVSFGSIDDLSPGMLALLAFAFRGHPEIEKELPYLRKRENSREKVKMLIKKLLFDEHFTRTVKEVVIENNQLLIPNLPVYIQASGRTSRLFAGGVTYGISFVLEKETFFEAFLQRAMYYEINFKKLSACDVSKIDFLSIKKRLDESRARYASSKENKDWIYPLFFVVESPTKAKQIARFFGHPSMFSLGEQPFYEVATGEHLLVITASLGHLVDLVEEGGYHGVTIDNGKFIPYYGSIKKCTKGDQFVAYKTCPRCGEPPAFDSHQRISNLVKVSRLAENLIIATDPDTEGEKIAYDVASLTAIARRARRAEFHEVTKKAVLQALMSPRNINHNLVKAQLVRRIEDRWIGFEISSILRERFNGTNLSAGRAQTPLLQWIVENYRKHQEKVRFYYLEIEGRRITLGTEEDLKIEMNNGDRVTLFIEKIAESQEVKLPPPPYTTDTLLDEANRLFKLSSKEIMRTLQKLFENGFITYHRTDSTRVSDAGLEIARLYLKEHFAGRKWQEKAEGAHECIRPTRAIDWKTLRELIEEGVIRTSDVISYRDFKVYDLVFKRFMASQCPPVRLLTLRYSLNFRGSGLTKEITRVVSVDGKAFELYPQIVSVEKPLPEGLQEATISVKRVPKVPLLTQADLVRLMKERRIGRPSTYSFLINRLFERGYVVEKNFRLIPTQKGQRVADYLAQEFSEFLSEERSRLLEELMDQVEKGDKDYLAVLQELYQEIQGIKEKGAVFATEKP